MKQFVKQSVRFIVTVFAVCGLIAVDIWNRIRDYWIGDTRTWPVYDPPGLGDPEEFTEFESLTSDDIERIREG